MGRHDAGRAGLTPAARGDVWLVDLGDPVGHEAGWHRPAVVVSDDRLNASRAGVVVVVPVTTTPRSVPSHVEIEPGASGLDEVSYAQAEALRSISTTRLVHRLGRADASVVDRLDDVLRLVLALP